MTTDRPLPEHNRAMLDEIARTWVLLPELRLGQLISHAFDAAGLSLALLPIVDDERAAASFVVLRAQMGHPDTPTGEQPGE